ncbi:MAG: type II toxin-antitoxin system VapC family toxin [Nitrospiria bacterium]
MLAYIDSSIILRIIFNEPDPLKDFSKISYGISSELLRVECLRTADRFRIKNDLSEDEYLERVEKIHDFISAIELIHITPEILDRATQPYPVSLGTLDAIHLSTCLLYKEKTQKDLILCTHDQGLKKASRSMGFKYLG